MERVKNPETIRPSHPDAKYQGAKVERSKQLRDGTNLTIELYVDSRKPEEWGTHPVTYSIDPVIDRSTIESLRDLALLSWKFTGPMAYLIREAIAEIDRDLVRPL